MDEIDKLFNIGNEETVEKILNKLLTKEDIELKTNVKNPKAIAQLSMIFDYLDERGLPKTSRVIKSFIEHYLEISPSRDGERAKQIVKAFSDIRMNEMGMQEDKRTLLGKRKEL